MQTLDRPRTSPPRGPRPSALLWALGGVAMVAVIVVAVVSQVGAFILLGLALVAGGAIWVWRKQFLFIELMAFLIHFDGLGFGPVRLGRILAGVALVVVAVKLLQGWRPLALPSRTWIPIWLFTLWILISGFWSPSIGGWFFSIAVYGLGVTYFIVAGLLVEDHQSVQKFLRAFWVGGLFGSFAGIVALFLGTRSVGFGGDPNFFGLLQAAMIPLTVYYRRNAPTLFAKRGYTLVLMYVLAGAAGAGSRSGLIGGAAVIVATMVTRPGLSAARRGGVAIGSMFLAGIAFLIGFVANPNNLERGFSDRGAGRLDLWGTTLRLIGDNPLFGYGFGQIRGILPQEMLLTQGSQVLSESRVDVSTHNTWLDVQADLGVIGLGLFVVVIAVALIGFAWPRWLETRELSTTMLVMMVPVITGSFFLPLLNNKLAWVLVGLSATLQAPSWSSRWPGWANAAAKERAGDTALVPAPFVPFGRNRTGTETGVVAGSGRDAGHDTSAGDPVPSVPPMLGGSPALPEPRLAHWDLSMRWPFLPMVLLVGLVGAVFAAGFVASQPTTYSGSAEFVVPQIDGSIGNGKVVFDRARLQNVLNAGVSLPFAAELGRLADLQASPAEIVDHLSATRPRMGMVVEIAYTAADRDEVLRVQAQIGNAMDAIYQASYDSAVAQTVNELRPMVPGESRVYDGPAFLHSYDHDRITQNPPRVAWSAFVGFISSAVLAAGVWAARQRRARLAEDDDLVTAIGIPVWTRLRRRRPWSPLDSRQAAQILASATDAAPGPTPPRRFVVAADAPNGAQRQAAVALSVALLNSGSRVVLVDADVDRPILSARLGVLRRAGVSDLALGDATLAEVIDRPSLRRLPGPLRKAVQNPEQLRVVGAGRAGTSVGALMNSLFKGGSSGIEVPAAAFDELSDDVSVVVLAPAVGAASEVFDWADAVIVGAEVGVSTTRSLDGTAAAAQLFSNAPAGVVVLDG